MEVVYVYVKQRRQFGRHCNFSDLPGELLHSIPPDAGQASEYVVSNPSHKEVQCVPEMSEHEVNTQQYSMTHQGIQHTEGGWPKDIDPTEMEHTNRYRKKVVKGEDYIRSIKDLGGSMDMCIKQNNAIDIYETYFNDATPDHSSEPPSAKTLAVFRDPNATKRTATAISWYPDGARKLAVAYSILDFQQMPDNMPVASYIWDVNNPNFPEAELVPASPLVCIEYNPKDPHVLVGGSYNGLLSVWDTRKGSAPTDTSPIEKSHRDPVYDVAWLQSKTGGEFASVSSDGQVLWWDMRNLSEPKEVLPLVDPRGEASVSLGGVVLDYDGVAGPSKFMVGTEHGVVLSCNRKTKNPADRIVNSYSGHHGPIYALQRNPFYPKYFLTVGDWTAKVWTDELKTPILSTKYHMCYLTDGCWSPTRPGVFFTTKMDGTLDVWDYLHKQNDPSLSIQVSDAGLHTLRVQDQGQLVATGAMDGLVTLMTVCDGLHQMQPGEKQGINSMFERETKREKNLEARYKESRMKERKKQESQKSDRKIEHSEEQLKALEDKFFQETRAPEDDDKARA
jgi:dynein intermediate chain 2